MLHDDIELFEQVIVRTSEELNVELPIVEKDYYVISTEQTPISNSKSAPRSSD